MNGIENGKKTARRQQTNSKKVLNSPDSIGLYNGSVAACNSIDLTFSSSFFQDYYSRSVLAASLATHFCSLFKTFS